jgi:hypothetical protein
MKRVAVVVGAGVALAGLAWGQATPPGRAPAAAPRGSAAPARGTTTPAARGPRNIDNALQALITLQADGRPLEELTQFLQDLTQTNMVVNWNALNKAGITRQTPVTLRLKDVSYEHVMQTLIELLPATGTRPNYAIEENTLELTTNAELGVDLTTKMVPVKLATTYTLADAITPDQQAANAQLLEKVLRAELARAGEPMDAKGHVLTIKGDSLAASVSERGQVILRRAMALFNAPLKVGQLASGTQLTAQARRAQDAYKAFLAGPAKATVAQMAQDLAKYPQFNLALLPGTADELAQAPPQTPQLEVAINDGGVLLIGPKAIVRGRTSLAVYDLRDIIRRLNSRNRIQPQPNATEYQAAIFQTVHDGLKPDKDGAWGGANDLGKPGGPTSLLIPYNGLLIVFATAETHRGIAAALQDINK